MTGQVVSKVGDRLSVKVFGTTYNTKLSNTLGIGDDVKVEFSANSKSIITVKLIVACDVCTKTCDLSADDIFDEFMASDDIKDYYDINDYYDMIEWGDIP